MDESQIHDGDYRRYRVSVRLVRERSGLYVPVELTGPEDTYRFLQDLEDFDRECFYALHLDSRHRVISCEEVSRGTVCSAPVHPREVYKGAILSNATAIIAAHNHPSGDPTPSADDRAITDRLYQAGDLLGIPLLDHVIIGDGRYESLASSAGL